MKQYNGEKAIISLTSWKARINTVGLTLFNLMQKCPGFHIVLVLSEEEFPNKELELPDSIMAFVNQNIIEILWVYKNYKSFKKVLFTMQKYKGVPVISADDDCIYSCNYAKELYDVWIEHPDCIVTNDGNYNNPPITLTRGPNTLYTYKLFKNVIDIIDEIDFSILNDDAFYSAIYLCNHIKIIDLHKKPFYNFHTKDDGLSDNITYKYSDTYFYKNQLKELLCL